MLVGVLLGAAASPAHDARTTFQVGAYVVESCEVSTGVSRAAARCAAAASRELRVSAPPQASVTGESAARDAATRAAPTSSPRDAAATATRVLLIRF